MTHFIAEVDSIHHRGLARCFDFIDTAARIGCDAVKFQLFKIDQLFAPEILAMQAAIATIRTGLTADSCALW